MGHKKTTKRRGRLRAIAAGLAAAAAAIIPGVAPAADIAVPDAIEAETRSTTPARLLQLANVHPDQVLANRALRHLRANDPDVHREIVLAARFARAEIALAQVMARTDDDTLRVFACDCAARVTPLYERCGARADVLELARARAVAAVAVRREARRTAAPPPPPASAFEMVLAKVEQNVDTAEQEVVAEAAATCGATSALRRLVFARSEEHVSQLENALSEDARDAARPFRDLAVALPAAEAIDEALLVAAGGTCTRINTMCEAIAEAVYLDHVFRTGAPAAAIDAVFRELAWQRSQLRALASGD